MLRFYSKIFAGISLLIALSSVAKAQFYYKDIWNSQQLIKEMAIVKHENIRTVSIKSFEDNGDPSKEFFCEKKIDRNYTMAQTVTRSNVTDQSLLTSLFNTKGLILRTTDSTVSSLNRTDYIYDNNDRIIEVKTFTKAEDEAVGIEESRSYNYNASGNIEKMARKKNMKQLSIVNFKADEKGNVIEEEEISSKGQRTKYFYYYDVNNRLTDVVNYNERANRLLPDYMYEYNDVGQITQMIATEVGSSNYYIWRYTYNDQQLRETERCLSKERRLLGSVQYQYK
jgi:hypothetical protein